VFIQENVLKTLKLRNYLQRYVLGIIWLYELLILSITHNTTKIQQFKYIVSRNVRTKIKAIK